VNSTILTIGMPVFNDIDFIEKSIQSVLAITDVSFHLILSDDGATDGSEAICKAYAEKDKRITYIKQKKNLGISKNMEFLLNEAKTEYFMWAADDDLWDKSFAKKLIKLLDDNQDVISAFCAFYLIDEEDNVISNVESYNYQEKSPFQRLKRFIKQPSDTFGYGIFRTEKIKNVTFPVWWWPNRKTPYNNIYPTLAYYLSLGDYRNFDQEVLFYKRIKTSAKTNHVLTGKGNGIKELFAFTIRRFNLVCVTAQKITSGSTVWVTIRIFPSLFFHWFIKTVFNEYIRVIQIKGKS
jgi:glycosyltransferase involved in cell wall biosynthesis